MIVLLIFALGSVAMALVSYRIYQNKSMRNSDGEGKTIPLEHCAVKNQENDMAVEGVPNICCNCQQNMQQFGYVNSISQDQIPVSDQHVG